MQQVHNNTNLTYIRFYFIYTVICLNTFPVKSISLIKGIHKFKQHLKIHYLPYNCFTYYSQSYFLMKDTNKFKVITHYNKLNVLHILKVLHVI